LFTPIKPSKKPKDFKFFVYFANSGLTPSLD